MTKAGCVSGLGIEMWQMLTHVESRREAMAAVVNILQYPYQEQAEIAMLLAR